jgi:hypothetical protein
MATLHFGTTDFKVFTPISSALNGLPNGAGTLIALFKKTVAADTDYCGLTNSASSAWYHALTQRGDDALFDDDGLSGAQATSASTDDATNWWIYACDWPGGGAAIERFHWRNQTSLGSWTHSPALANNGGMRAGPGTGGWWRCGSVGDFVAGQKDMAVVAAWAGVRFADGDYGSWSKTSDLYNHSAGQPTFLCELTSSTPTDIGANPSTYSSANSVGTSLSGADPDNWTFDGQGAPAGQQVFVPHRMPLGV